MIVHTAIGLRGIEAIIRERGNPGLLMKDGRSLPTEEALAAIRAKRQAGYDVWPPCDNVDSRGHCQGHRKEA